MAKKRKKILGGKHIIIISSIIVLNAMGVSYSYWTDQLQIDTTLKTGSINPTFCKENYWINIVRDGSEKGNYPGWDDNKDGNPHDDESTLSNLDITFDEKRQTMFIEGELEEGYKAFIHYCVVNNGTIPIKYMQKESKKSRHEELKMQDGLKVQVEQPSEILEPHEKLFTEHSNGNPKIEIQVPNQSVGKGQSKNNEDPKVEEDRYTFEIDLPFYQWTGDKSSYRGNEDED